MAKYVTKNVDRIMTALMVFDNESKKPITIPALFNKKPSEHELKKYASARNCRFLKVKGAETISKRMRMTTAEFMAYANELKPGDSKSGLVTRTICDTFTTLLVFNDDTEDMEEIEVHMNVVNLDKVELVGKTACDIVSRREVQHTYGMPVETFIKYAEEF